MGSKKSETCVGDLHGEIRHDWDYAPNLPGYPHSAVYLMFQRVTFKFGKLVHLITE